MNNFEVTVHNLYISQKVSSLVALSRWLNISRFLSQKLLLLTLQ